MLPERIALPAADAVAAIASVLMMREGLVAAAALAGIVTGFAFGALLGTWRLRRAMRAPVARLEALAAGDDASPVPGAARRDVAGEVARATERIVSSVTAARRAEAALRAALDEAAARAAAAERRAGEAEARADEAMARRDGAAESLAAAVAAILAEELAEDGTAADEAVREVA